MENFRQKHEEAAIYSVSILGSGWLGLPLARHLVEKGYCVKASTTSEPRLAFLKENNIEPFIIDIANIPDHIGYFLRSDILIVNIPSKNIPAFSDLITEIQKSPVTKVIFVSSTSVYMDKDEIITESDTAALASSPLVTIEEMFRDCSQFKTTIIRFGGLIGYSRNPGKFFSSGKDVKKPDSRVNLIHRDDCIGIISKVIEDEVWGEVFNCCADTHPTKREFYTQAARAIGEKIPDFADSRKTPAKIVSNEKVKRVLKYNFAHPDLMKIHFT